MSDKVICIGGPTASGKTAVSIDLCMRLGGEVVSCDSMQVYKGMDIGTAKALPGERKTVPHHMLDIVSPGEDYSVSRFVEEGMAAISDILRRGKIPILVGGTGLYMDALVRGHSFEEGEQGSEIRTRISKLADRFGSERLHRLLTTLDPESAGKLHPKDRRRIIRALEVGFLTGRKLSEHNEKTASLRPKFDALYFGIDPGERNELYERCDRRVDEMFARGLPKEVRRLIDRGVPKDSTAMQAIGYKELYPVLERNGDPEIAKDAVKQATRRYAKRQLTWFRQVPGLIWLSAPSGNRQCLVDAAVGFSLRFFARQDRE